MQVKKLNWGKQLLLRSLVIVFVWACGMFLLATVGLYRFNFAADTAYEWMTPDFFNQDKDFIGALSGWDGKWYIDVAQRGYKFVEDDLSNVAFLPLYPALLRGLNTVTHNYYYAGLIIDLLALIGAVYFLQKLARLEKCTEKQKNNALFYLLIYPTAIFYVALYTEALFVFLAIATFYFLKQEKFWIAGLFGLFAALTRIPGVFLFFPFAYYLYESRAKIGNWFASLLLPLGTLIYLLLQKLYTGNALAFLTAQKNWGRTFLQINWGYYEHMSPAGMVNSSVDIGMTLLFIGGLYLVWKKLDFGYVLFCAAAVFVPLLTGSTFSIVRFGMVLFPYFLALAKVERPWVERAWTVVSLGLLTIYTIGFMNGYWAG